MRNERVWGSLFLALVLSACSSDGGGGAPAGAGCEPGERLCDGDDVTVCNLAGTAYVFDRACAPGGSCQDGVCAGVEAGEGEADGGADEQVAPEGEAPGEGGEGEEALDVPQRAGEGEGEEALDVPPDAGEGEGEPEPAGEGEGEGDAAPGEEGDDEAPGEEGDDEGDPGEEGEGEPPPPPQCEENADCPGLQECDPAQLICIEGVGCDDDGDCLNDRRCYDSLCTDPCLENADCPGSRQCVEGLCPEPALCFGPDDCDRGRVCRAGACEPGCAAPGDCPGAQSCDVEQGRCVEPEVCGHDDDCSGDRLCHATRCVNPCDDDADCPGTRQCHVERRLCLEPAQCIIPADCDPGRRCVGGTCRGVCDAPDGCPGNQRCDVGRGLCEEAANCEDDVDCLGARVCAGQRCEPSCVQAGCPGRQVCDAGDGHCQEPDDCLGDVDCLGPRVCGPAGQCYDPGCSLHGDCGDGQDCVDSLCADPRAPACEDDEGCVEGQICVAAGACVRASPCEGDDACPAAAGVCDEGRCVQCAVDRDCTLTEQCADQRCEYLGGCDLDGDCPGDRTCEAGDCRPADCEPDRFDGADGPAPLWAATYTGLRLCDGDEDRYGALLGPDEGLTVTLRHDVGDLSLELYDAANPFEPLSTSDGPWGVERLSVAPSPAPMQVEIAVRGRLGRSVPYSLDLRAGADGPCAPDAFEGLLGNNDPGRASLIGVGEARISICPADVDWLALDLLAGSRFEVAAEVLGGGDGLAVTLHDPDGGELAEAQQSPFGLGAAADAPAPGRYLIRVAHDDDLAEVGVRLQIGVLASRGSEAAACAHAPVLSPRDPVAWRRGVPVRRFAASCGDEFAPDFAATFELPGQAIVSISSAGAVALALRGECDARPSERACLAAPDPTLGPLPLDAGVYTVIAHSFDGRPPLLRLDVAVFCGVDGDCPGGEVCDGGRCHAPCEADDDCPGAQTCGGGGHCDEPDLCAADDDCAGLRACRYDGACFVADCELHDDCAGACLDRACVDAEPRACRGDGDCAAGLRCAPVGACVRAEPCGDDDDCPAGAPICAAGDCVACQGERGCSAAESCGEGRCRFVGFCDDDGDCPGTRVCAGGDCEPAGDCVGDRYDADDGPFRVLGRRGYGGLVRCDGTTDVYTTTVPAGEAVRVTLRHAPGDGDLSLALELPGPPPQGLASSDQRHGVEVVSAGPFGADQDLNVVVGGRAGFDVAYSLTVERADPNQCPPDGHEGPLGNDGRDRATSVGVGSYDHEVCEGDEDWFAIRLQAGTDLTATTSTRGGAELLLTVVDPEGGELAQGEAGPEGWVARATAEWPGAYGVRVRAANDAVRAEAGLRLEAEAAGNAALLACAHAAEVRLNGPAVALGPGPAVERFGVPCALGLPGLSADFLWTFELQQAESVDLVVTAGEAVLVRSICAAADSEVACGPVGSEDLEGMALEAGRYWVIVQTTGGLRPTVRVVRSE